MTSRYIANPSEIINPENLKPEEKFLFSIQYDMYPDKNIRVYKKEGYLVVHTTYCSKLKKIWRSDQEEFPLEALPWIVDRFENGFFKPQDQGQNMQDAAADIRRAKQTISHFTNTHPSCRRHLNLLRIFVQYDLRRK